MTYGAHLYLWTDEVTTESIQALVQRAPGLGLGFVEVPVGDDVDFDAQAVRDCAQAHQVELVLSPGALWPMEYDVALPPPQHRQGIDWHRRQIDRAAACGAVAYTGAIYGHPGRVLRSPQPVAEKERIAAALHELAAHAQAAGLPLVIEPMSHFRTHIVNTPRQANDLIRAAGHANLAILLDTYHLCTEIGSYARAILDALPRLWGVHACENHRGVPGQGFLPWGEITDTLVRCGWHGYVGLESYNSRCRGGEFAISRTMFHDVCPDGDQFVRQALAFLRPRLEPSAGP